MCGRRRRWRLGEYRARSGGKTMIDWDADDWGNGVTYAADGSWVLDRHGDDDVAVG